MDGSDSLSLLSIYLFQTKAAGGAEKSFCFLSFVVAVTDEFSLRHLQIRFVNIAFCQRDRRS